MSTIEKRDEAIDLARYKQAAGEVETGNRDDALWYKAFADGGGDENATKAAYIRLRVEQLRRRAADAASAVRVGAKSLYDVLGIPRDASDEQIHAGYQQQKWQLETQENKGAETTKKLLIIEHAKRVLLDPARRAAYDARITTEAAQPEKAQQGKSSGSSSTSVNEPPSNRELYAAYLGEKNQDYYLNKFEEFDQQGDGMHISWNWWACIGGPTWLLYRKLYAWSFAAVLFHIILNMVLDLSTNLSSNSISLILFLWGIIFFGVATFGNALYYRRVKSKITAAQIIARNDNQLVEILRKKGGVHTWVVWVVSAFWIIAVIGIIAAIAIPAYSDYTKKAKKVGEQPVQEQQEIQSSDKEQDVQTKPPIYQPELQTEISQEEREQIAAQETTKRIQRMKAAGDNKGILREIDAGNKYLVSAYPAIALALMSAERYAEARDVLIEAEKIYPNDATLKHAMGVTYFNLRQDDLAVWKIEQALTLAPEDQQIREGLQKIKQLIHNEAAQAEKRSKNSGIVLCKSHPEACR